METDFMGSIQVGMGVLNPKRSIKGFMPKILVVKLVFILGVKKRKTPVLKIVACAPLNLKTRVFCPQL